MMKRVYLDHNVIVDVAKGHFNLKPDPSFVWVYSNEHFNEIRRGTDTSPLDVLSQLRAQKLELKLNNAFQITGEFCLRGDVDPRTLYDNWHESNAEAGFQEDFLSPVLARMLGAENDETLAGLPELFEHEVTGALQSAGLLDDSQQERITRARGAMKSMLFEHLAKPPDLEELREALGTHGGRGGNLMKDQNPLAVFWNTIGQKFPGVTADQIFGFEQLEAGESDQSPIYLGVIGCYLAMNIFGLCPDEKLRRGRRLPAIMSDACHAGYAAYCDVLLSADRRFCDKASAICKYKNIPTQVLLLQRNIRP